MTEFKYTTGPMDAARAGAGKRAARGISDLLQDLDTRSYADIMDFVIDLAKEDRSDPALKKLHKLLSSDPVFTRSMVETVLSDALESMSANSQENLTKALKIGPDSIDIVKGKAVVTPNSKYKKAIKSMKDHIKLAFDSSRKNTKKSVPQHLTHNRFKHQADKYAAAMEKFPDAFDVEPAVGDEFVHPELEAFLQEKDDAFTKRSIASGREAYAPWTRSTGKTAKVMSALEAAETPDELDNVKNLVEDLLGEESALVKEYQSEIDTLRGGRAELAKEATLEAKLAESKTKETKRRVTNAIGTIRADKAPGPRERFYHPKGGELNQKYWPLSFGKETDVPRNVLRDIEVAMGLRDFPIDQYRPPRESELVSSAFYTPLGEQGTASPNMDPLVELSDDYMFGQQHAEGPPDEFSSGIKGLDDKPTHKPLTKKQTRRFGRGLDKVSLEQMDSPVPLKTLLDMVESVQGSKAQKAEALSNIAAMIKANAENQPASKQQLQGIMSMIQGNAALDAATAPEPKVAKSAIADLMSTIQGNAAKVDTKKKGIIGGIAGSILENAKSVEAAEEAAAKAAKFVPRTLSKVKGIMGSGLFKTAGLVAGPLDILFESMAWRARSKEVDEIKRRRAEIPTASDRLLQMAAETEIMKRRSNLMQNDPGTYKKLLELMNPRPQLAPGQFAMGVNGGEPSNQDVDALLAALG